MANTSDIIIDTLKNWGVEVIFGLPGDGINGLMESLRQRKEDIDFVLVRHEEAAAFAASGYAKFTGKIGVCLATSGPGAIHLLNGLYDAKSDLQSVVAITGQQYSDLIGSRYQQEVNLLQLFSDVAGYNVQVNSPEHARMATDLACRYAIGGRTVSHINVPVDLQVKEMEGDYSDKHVPGATSQTRINFALRPAAADIQRAAAILDGAERPLIFIGQGAHGAREEVMSLAKRIQAPIVKALLGKDVVPDDDPYVLGGAGLLGTLPSEEAIEKCDAILMVGTSFPYMQHLPDPGKARGIQIDIDPTRLGLRYPVEVAIPADSRTALQDLLGAVKAREPTKWIQGLQKDRENWLDTLQHRGERDDKPLKPQRVAWELGKRLADDAVIISDSGTIATWAARYIQIRGNQRFSLSGTLASMAPGLPYAMAAQVAFPDRQVVAVIGDGGTLMLGSELSAIAARNLPVKIVTIKNGSLGMIKWEQMVFLGNPSYGVELPDVDFVKFAESQGVKGFHLEEPNETGDVLDRFLAHDGPALLEAAVDPHEPPQPPRIEMDQAVKMAKALARGQPNAKRIGLTLFRDKYEDIVKA